MEILLLAAGFFIGYREDHPCPWKQPPINIDPPVDIDPGSMLGYSY